MSDTLPPLPEPCDDYVVPFYTADQLRAYALAARQQAQVPEGFVLVPVEFIEAGQRVAQEYARTNPKWPMWDNGEAEPKVQDPCGVHAWLEQAAMLAAATAAPAPEAQAARAALAQRQPLTDEQIAEGRYRMWADELDDAPEPWSFLKGARWAERYYGIGGATTGEQHG